MVSKTLKKKVQVKPAKSTVVVPVVDSAKEIWFAGLGMFSVAQQEGEKLIEQGGKLFDKLVAEGTRLEKKSLDVAETTVDEIKSDVEAVFEDVRQQANENWDSIGNIFDERVSGTLERLGIPTTKDLNKLSGRVQTMGRKATNSWKEFEVMFEKRVSSALDSLRVPGAEDLSKLSDSVQKVSRDTTENLGKLESAFEKRVSGAIGNLEAVTGDEFKKLSSGMQDVARQVTENWDKLESVVEARVAEVMGGLSIPSTDDTNRLAAELKKLSTQVSNLEKQLKANAKVKAVVRKPAATKAATSMTVAEKKKAAEAISKMKPAR